MRKIDGPGNVSGEFADYDPVTNPNGTVVTADWANDVQDELLGVQDEASIAEAAGSSEYVRAAVIFMTKRYSLEVGEMRTIPGEVKAPVAFDKDAPTTFFPALCATDIAKGESKTISTANWPDLVPELRTKRMRYLDGLTGDTVNFTGSVSGSVLTLDTNTANDDLLAALVEYQADYGTYTSWLSGDIDGTTHEITAVDAVARTITFATEPTAGAGNLTIYPHRIAGSTTTARVHSLAGKAMVGAGTTEILSMGMRRDRFQGFSIEAAFHEGGPDANLGRISSNNVAGSGVSSAVEKLPGNELVSDTTNGTPRTGTTTHPADYGVHMYYHGGTYTV